MEIRLIGAPKNIISNPQGVHNYFAWPSIARLKNGKIAVGCSGYRIHHICPFGKAVVAVSEDEGEHYSSPFVIIDTVLDDRDAGLCPFGKSGLLVSSFNNTLEFQKNHANDDSYCLSYIQRVSGVQESRALGSTYRISFDNGITFGPIFKSPITSPHGPIELADGTILWVGRVFSPDDSFAANTNYIQVFSLSVDGGMKQIGNIENIKDEFGLLFSCEPNTMQLPDGTVICHIRVQRPGEHEVFTLYQSESFDFGVSWTKPHPLLEPLEGAPAHLLLHSSGALICVYGHRKPPYGIKAMLSFDNAKSWSKGQSLYTNTTTADLGYPATVELDDGSLITVFYAHSESGSPAEIIQQKWRF